MYYLYIWHFDFESQGSTLYTSSCHPDSAYAVDLALKTICIGLNVCYCYNASFSSGTCSPGSGSISVEPSLL